MRETLRWLSTPFSALYAAGVTIRNRMYDIGWLRSQDAPIPTICVGNLALGGTGKTPMVDLLLRLLKRDMKVAVLSRGYGRKTEGYRLAGDADGFESIGDEPALLRMRHPDVPLAVCADRLQGIARLLHDRPETGIVLLDDAFQHRRLRAGVSILLTEYGNPYSEDRMFPTGRLRDVRGSATRADMVVVTKCPSALTREEAGGFRARLRLGPSQRLYFTTLEHGEPYPILGSGVSPWDPEAAALLFCGIANPTPLREWLVGNARSSEVLQFPDHHAYTAADIRRVRARFDAMGAEHKAVLTTEKDAVRLSAHAALLSGMPIFAIPVSHAFLFGEEGNFISFLRELLLGSRATAGGDA